MTKRERGDLTYTIVASAIVFTFNGRDDFLSMTIRLPRSTRT